MREKPFIRVVAEVTLDGKTTLGLGKSSRALFTFQNPDLKFFTHQQRAYFDGILVGAQTIRTDNPFLTIRGLKAKQPTRIIVTKSCDFDSNSHIFDGATRTLLIVPRSVDQQKVTRITSSKIQVIFCGDEFVCLNELMNQLININVRRLIVEGGQKIIEQFLRADLVDEILIKQIPIFVAGKNTPTLLPFSADLNGRELVKWKLKQLINVGGHAVTLYER